MTSPGSMKMRVIRSRACCDPTVTTTFAHAAEYELPSGRKLLDSYHCSRYNTQTRRLTEAMFLRVFERARALIDEMR